VLLKNNAGLLPLQPTQHILVAGDGRHDVGKQAGGWTLNWQGTGTRRKDFPNADTIFEGYCGAGKRLGRSAESGAD